MNGKPQIYLLVDESGRLGNSNKSTNPNHITVVAGVIIHNHPPTFIQFSDHINAILKKHINKEQYDKKEHITDLPINIMEKLRSDIFQTIINFNLPLVFTAITPSKLHNKYIEQTNEHDKTYQNLDNLGISISKNTAHFIQSYQVEAFSNVYLKSAIYGLEVFQSPVDIQVRTDNIDSALFKSYKYEIEKRHKIHEDKPLSGTRYIRKTNEVQKFSVSAKSKINHPIDTLIRASSGNLSIDSPIHSIVADVIANSVHHYLKKYIETQGVENFDESEAIKQHPLYEHFIYKKKTYKYY